MARTATRTIALYFSRPVRLFRPTKGNRPGKLERSVLIWTILCVAVSGWHTLKNLAMQQGTTVTFQYFTSLIKARGVQSPSTSHLSPFNFVLPSSGLYLNIFCLQ